MPQSYGLSIFADYFQFYVQDLDTAEDFSDGWTDETVAAMLVAKTNALGIGTARNMFVPVRLEIHETEPPQPAGWDRQNTAPLNLPSGRVQVMGCTGYGAEAFNAEIEPGEYLARISYLALNTLSEDGLDGDDRYVIQLWPAPLSPLTLLPI